MKLMILLLSFSTGLLLASCESEYQHRMKQARELVRQELKVRQTMEEDFTPESVEALAQLKREIDFHAHLSGNEPVFFSELAVFENQLAQDQRGNLFISKYP